ncbi:hypothetical protein [Sphingomonas xinjiangensis]|uniref:Uncharacterized protein n=1 Tax=Sphingomonas xinjiangensis TaxID=643568 RepID=A0A840YTY9_9SPHN|nr:hypothetical protein [Sphingomonas xinjiangensis]MBB5713154.1 hypothetical protein [Sphingomonas xinjiangensis]
MQLILMALLLTAALEIAVAQTSFGLSSKPSKRAELAMPLAKCIWKQRYSEALAFANDLENSLKANVALERLRALQRSCPNLSAEGDVVGAIIHSRQAAVGECLRRKAPQSYQLFQKAAKKGTPAAKRFVEQGFPEALKAAAVECDVTLTYDFAQAERTDFGGRVLGWW